MRPQEMDCAVIIVTHNSAASITSLLDSIPAAAEGLCYKIIVVDNGSHDDTVERARRHGAATCIQSRVNLGYAGGINLGRTATDSAQTVLILNADLRLNRRCISLLRDAVGIPGVGIAIPRLVDTHGQTLHSLRRDPSLPRAIGEALLGTGGDWRPGWSTGSVRNPAAYASIHEIEWATGAAVMLSRDCDRAIGDWDERFFMYSEEVDACLRARQAGFVIQYRPEATAVHLRQGSGRSQDLVALRVLNEVRLYRKYHGRAATAAFRLVTGLRWMVRAREPDNVRTARIALGIEPPPSFPAAASRVTPVPW